MTEQVGDTNPTGTRYVNIEHREDPAWRYAVPEEALPHYRRQGFHPTTWEDDGTEYETPAQRAKLEEEALKAAKVVEKVEREEAKTGQPVSDRELRHRVEEATDK